jgi:Effector Associated Constant Component 1
MPELLLSIGTDADTDEHELAELSGWLRRELLELNVESVEPAGTGDAPRGAKGLETLGVGALVVQLAQSAGMLRAVLGTVQSWLAGYRGRTVKIEMDGDVIEMTGVSSSDQQRLIDAWVTRHAI